MSTGPRLLLFLGLFIALAGGALFVALGGLALLGQECGELPELLGRLTKERRRGAELDRQQERSLHRVAVKRQTLAELIDGRLSLVEAAARFRDLEEVADDPPPPPGRSGRGGADGERLCREVIQWVYEQLRWSDPELAAKMAARLEAELRQHLASGQPF